MGMIIMCNLHPLGTLLLHNNNNFMDTKLSKQSDKVLHVISPRLQHTKLERALSRAHTFAFHKIGH